MFTTSAFINTYLQASEEMNSPLQSALNDVNIIDTLHIPANTH